MNFFSKMFGKKDKHEQRMKSVHDVTNSECKKITELNTLLSSYLAQDHYVARSEYANNISEYEKVVEYFRVLESSGMLSSFCSQNGVSEKNIQDIIVCFDSLRERVDAANENYIVATMISEKEYLDNILKDVDPDISLDEDQRRVILTDEDYCLVIAGAGAGKTTTVAAKVRYLVDRKEIDPNDILVISFTNKAVGELREKINKNLNIECPIATFHSTGNAILHIHNPEQLNIVEGSKLYYLIQDYFRDSILQNESLVNNLILFFASYFDAPYEGDDLNEFFNKTAKSNFTTMRSDLDEFKREIIDRRSKKNITIQNEVLRSYQEVEIANFLYLNNIEYEYEPLYPYNIAFARKPYTPDFLIKQGDRVAYIEHFGVTEDGKNDRYSEADLNRYKKSINDKVRLHWEHGTTLIYTFSAYRDRKELTAHLQDKLEEAGFILNRRSNKEIMEKLIASEESKYIRRLVSLICRFITNFKTNGFAVDEFSRMYHSTKNVRSRLFLNICEDCYLEYERYLKENNAVDFEDMINESARILRDVKEMKQRLHFKYIIVDEYQDISRQRFDLTTALSEVCDGKIIAVGDDWQSIYAFSGSDITLFTKFEEKMGYAKLLKIVRTYRNAQDVIDIAGNFIQKNPTQIEKSLISSKKIEDPVIIYTYDASYKKGNDNRKSGALYATACAVETAIEQIIKYNRASGKKEGEDGTILLLGRYNFDGDHLQNTGLFEYRSRGNKIKSVKYPKLDITFMTVHMSKGLGYDNVIVVNGKNEAYGFPSKIEDDPVLSFVIKGDNSIDYAEERRLFYVAMTRTKNRVFFIAPEQNPSEFLLEIKHDYKNVILRGNWNEEAIKQNITRKSCPICGYPMQYRYKNSYGLRLHICTNEPEICGFMTNDIKAGKLSIIKCEQCRDGYLIARSGGRDGSYFLGCTNYKPNGQGCNNTVSAEDYYAQMGMEYNAMVATGSPDHFEKNVITQKNEKSDESKNKANEASVNFEKHKIKKEDINQKAKVKNTEDILLFPTIEEVCNQDKREEVLLFPEHDIKKLISCSTAQIDDFKEVAATILNCLISISEERFWGITVLIDTLRGSKKKLILTNNLQEVKEYGNLDYLKWDEIRAIIQWLLDNHYIIQTKGLYPKLHITYEGNNFEESITPGQIKKLKKYFEDPNRESFENKEGEE